MGSFSSQAKFALPRYVTGRSHDVTKFESSRDVAVVEKGCPFFVCFVLFSENAFDKHIKMSVLHKHNNKVKRTIGKRLQVCMAKIK